MDLYFLNKAQCWRPGTIAGAGKRRRAHRLADVVGEIPVEAV